MCCDRFDRIQKLGAIRFVKGYRYIGRYSVKEAVMVVGENGTARFGGLLWGYKGTGPRGLLELLAKLSVSKDVAENIAFNIPRRHECGEDWRLILSPCFNVTCIRNN
jgi:hypothetical protein